MAVVIASDLKKDIAGEPLLRGVSFKLERRDRMTLSGRNGAGKTTLLRMLAGEASIDGGELVFSKGAKVALHDQRPPRDREISLRDYILSGAPELVAIEAELDRLEQAMAGGAHDEATLERYSAAQARLEHAGGYNWRDRALATLHGLGFRDDADLDRALATFSGGELTRASLGRALAGDPDLLLLDEPTNHLDIASLEWLESHLVSLDAAIVLVAHDRWFLEAVGTSVLELEAGRGKFFAGTWHQWRREKAARELALGRAIERQEAEIERLERFVTRFRAGTRARQAQSRAKKLSKIDRLSRDPTDGAGLEFAFKAPERSGRVVFELEHASLSAGGKHLLDDADLWLERGEHVSLVGANGTGKTTLIETLAGQRELAEGKLRVGHNVQIGFLSQHAEELSARHGAHRARGRPARHRPDPRQDPGAARPLPVLRRGCREAARRALRRRAPPSVAGDPRPFRRQPADPRRADQPPRSGEPRGARVGAAVVPRLAAARLPRPGAARRDRDPYGGARGPHSAQLRRRLARVRAGARRAQRQAGTRTGPPASAARTSRMPRAPSRTPPAPSARHRPSAATAPRGSRPRSRPPRRPWRPSRTSSPIPPPGPRRPPPPARRPSTKRPSRPSPSSTSATRRSPADGFVGAGAYTRSHMAPSGVRLALIDDDSGLVAVLDRRLAALGWQREVLGYGASHDQLAALRLHALIVNPGIVGLDYVERIGGRAARTRSARRRRARARGRPGAGAAGRRR